MTPSGIFAMMMLPVVSRLLSRGVDARWLVVAGTLTMATGCFWMAHMNLFISPGQMVWPRVVRGVGQSILFSPLNVVAFATLSTRLRGSATGLFALLRNEGGSIGTSLAKVLCERREQFHSQRLGEWLDPINPTLGDTLGGLRTSLQGYTGDSAGADSLAWQLVSDMRGQQAVSLAYFDCFWACGVLALVIVPLVLLMKRSANARGAHLAAE